MRAALGLPRLIRLTSAWNSVRGNGLSNWLNMLQNPLMGEPPVGWGVEPWSVSTPPYPRELIRCQRLIRFDLAKSDTGTNEQATVQGA